jgi:hypothetical protein
MFSGMPIVFFGTAFGGITAGATYYIGTIVPGYPTSTITVTSLPGGAVFGLTTATGTMTGTFSSGGQQIIDIGSVPNDGTGDPLRTAFNDTNLNFDQVFAAGPVGTNVQIANNTILTTNTNGNLVLAPNGTGVVKSNVSIVPNTANIRNLGSATNRWATVYTQYIDVSSGTSVNGDLTVTGNLTVQGNIIQVGNIVTETLTIQLANSASTANAANGAGITVGATDDIATLLYNSTSNVWTTNIGVSSVGNISAPYLFGNGSQLIGLPASYSNANVVTLLAGFGSNTVSTTGNISGGYFFGNVSQANGFPAGYANANAVAYGEAGWAGNIVPSGNAVYSLGNSTNQWNDLYVSNTTIYMNNVPVSLTAGNVLTVNGNAVLQNNSNSTISTTGNITADYFFGDGSQLTGISTANIGNVTFDDVNVIGTGNLNLQPNGASSEYLNIYLTGAADIHVAYGGGSGNVILGTDEQANVAVLLDGNVAIQAGNVAGTKTWTFDTASNLTLPMGGVVYETNIPDGALSGSAIALTPPGGTNADQQLLIYPTVNDANHLHLTTGNLYNTELFLGNDNLYVKLANTGNIVVNSNDAAGNSAQWTFDTTGNATFPANGTTNLHDVVSVGLATFSNVRIGGNLNYAESANLIVVENKDGFADIIAQNQNAGGNASMNIVLVNNDPGNVYMAVGVNSSTFTPLYNTLFEIPDAGYVSHSTTQVMGPQSAESGNSNMFFTYSSGSYALELNANGAIGWGASYNGNLTQGNFGNVGQVLTSAGANSPPTWNNFSSIANGTSNVNIATANGNVTIAANASSTWTFSTSGNLSAPGNVSAVGNVTGNYIFGNGSQLTGLPATYGNANVATFLAAYGSNTISTSGNVTAGNIIGNISITGNVQGTTANVTLVAGSYNWTFDNTGNLTLPGNTFSINYANGTQVPLGGGSDYNDSNVATFLASYGSNTISTTGNITAGNLIATGNVYTPRVLNGGSGLTIDAGYPGFVQFFNSNGSTVLIGDDGNISAVGNITTAGNFVGNLVATTVSATGNVTAGNISANNFVINGQTLTATGLINSSYLLAQNNADQTAGQDVAVNFQTTDTSNGSLINKISNSQVTLTAGNTYKLEGIVRRMTSSSTWGAFRWYDVTNTTYVGIEGFSEVVTSGGAIGSTCVATAYVTPSANTTYELRQTTVNTITVSANYASMEVTQVNPTASLSAVSTISATGNVTANSFVGNGATLSNVATTFESAWTVPVGNSTQSFTVTASNTYYMWVDCNIPNGILTWNATATVTNTNVPVVGAQYAWVYTGGGTPIDFTSIPNQFVGTANTIVRSSVAPSATTNRFDFGINNTSGNAVTVRYGWAQIS